MLFLQTFADNNFFLLYSDAVGGYPVVFHLIIVESIFSFPCISLLFLFIHRHL